MSELINNSAERKAKLKKLILKLHSGETEDAVRKELLETLSQIPYGEGVEVDQELISEGLPESEVLKLCDVHSAVLEGKIDLSSSKKVPDGHPVDVMKKENAEIKKVTSQISQLIMTIDFDRNIDLKENVLKLHSLFNSLWDVDKHY